MRIIYPWVLILDIGEIQVTVEYAKLNAAIGLSAIPLCKYQSSAKEIKNHYF
jgi:hypothetical protein